MVRGDDKSCSMWKILVQKTELLRSMRIIGGNTFID